MAALQEFIFCSRLTASSSSNTGGGWGGGTAHVVMSRFRGGSACDASTSFSETRCFISLFVAELARPPALRRGSSLGKVHKVGSAGVEARQLSH